ncbi:unnamed protein product [Cyclocybe aegerita]|uniref:Initiator tRNA phosphoribosyl transferase n=1 Tax=Cyclocybe aegerita TaxID=1973307 RepID=A0A8S0WD82_CYCAE|nr:unnamed protein product [Cyclocybe aegerita]
MALRNDTLPDNSNPLEYIRRESLDIFNRLHSIEEDVEFVKRVHAAYKDTPFLPNLRCGAWYTDPSLATDVPAYFKSTDGHFNNWSFNLRRANLHLLPLILKCYGIILIDSTRAGKRIPDALSKTVPIWCAVINRALLIRHPEQIRDREHLSWDISLYTPPVAVSMQEHHQIELRLDRWAHVLAASSFELPVLPGPLRPLWITPASSAFPRFPDVRAGQREFLPVVCVSASRQVDQGVERRTSGFSYVQGSGDDHELWGMGLTPAMFWTHRDNLLSAGRLELPELVSAIVSQEASSFPSEIKSPTPIERVEGRVLICTLTDVPASLPHPVGLADVYVTLTPSAEPPPSNRHKLYVPVLAGKRGQAHFLRIVLPTTSRFIREHLHNGETVCIACESGKDLSVGVALAALQLFFRDDGTFRDLGTVSFEKDMTAKAFSKNSIRTRLEWIIASRPQANPSRATLKRVNEFLLSPPSFRTSPRVDVS